MDTNFILQKNALPSGDGMAVRSKGLYQYLMPPSSTFPQLYYSFKSTFFRMFVLCPRSESIQKVNAETYSSNFARHRQELSDPIVW